MIAESTIRVPLIANSEMGFKLATLFREYHDSIHEPSSIPYEGKHEIPILEDFRLRAYLAKVRSHIAGIYCYALQTSRSQVQYSGDSEVVRYDIKVVVRLIVAGARVVNSAYASAWTAIQNLFPNWSSVSTYYTVL